MTKMFGSAKDFFAKGKQIQNSFGICNFEFVICLPARQNGVAGG